MLKLFNNSLQKFGITVTLSFIFSSIETIKNNNLLLAANVDSPTVISNIRDTEDDKIYQTIIDRVSEDLKQASTGKIIQTVAEQFIGAEYQAGLLDRSLQETLVISLQQFDCLLFVETVLAIANNIAQESDNYQAFTKEIEDRRYWNSKMNGYYSRLHYFSDWIEDNQRRGNVQNITSHLGGADTVKKLNFVTTHRSSYSNLAKSDANFKCIARVEDSLPEIFNYIPTQDIKQVYSQLQPGDIVGIATDIEGLDFTHTGFVYRQSDSDIGLIHASPAGEVVIAPDLQNYVANVNHATGIVVIRANSSSSM